MTLVTAHKLVRPHLCSANEENKNNLQVCTHVHVVRCHSFFGGNYHQLFKHLKAISHEKEHVFHRQNYQINCLGNYGYTLPHQHC